MGVVKRSQKLAFYGVPGDGSTETFTRMKGMTSLATSKNAKEYSRQYIDEDTEVTDVIGYAPSISYGFDQITGDTVHGDIIGITDEEKTGDEAVRNIIAVDKTQAGSTTGSYKAIKRAYSVVPDSEGDGTDAYAYSGTFKAKGERIEGDASISQDGLTVTFTIPVIPTVPETPSPADGE